MTFGYTNQYWTLGRQTQAIGRILHTSRRKKFKFSCLPAQQVHIHTVIIYLMYVTLIETWRNPRPDDLTPEISKCYFPLHKRF